MQKNFSDRIENNIQLDKDSVWVLSNHKIFDYSDGIDVERYLRKVFTQATDLSSNSHELDRWIKDWPSEYHLSRKRSQLLRGFDFDKTNKVLEVGCGCGAITRFLGETFNDVVSIEGSLARARLARLRTKGMNNVSILCGPFQEIKFKERFDIIFCIGVFEYSGSFVKAHDPYDAILKYFADLLNPCGTIVLAIENQFGLKYFSSSREDHTNRMFEGIEGYPHFGNKIRTFGYDVLKAELSKYFAKVDFYFPYPDYKIPSCVLSEKFLNKVNAGELVGKFRSRDYSADIEPLFDESLVYLELDKNNKLPFFSNSFLVIAGKQESSPVELQALGFMYTNDRAYNYQTITLFTEHKDKSIWAHKRPLNPDNEASMLLLHPTSNKWESGLSLQGLMAQRVRVKHSNLKEIFAPCKPWLRALKSVSTIENNKEVVDGKYIDCNWSNSFVYNNDCVFIDQELEWHEKVSINIIVIRALYCFLNEIAHVTDLHRDIKSNRTTSLMMRIAQAIGAEVDQTDFKAFSKLESQIYGIVANKNIFNIRLIIGLYLWNRAVVKILLNSRKKINTLRMQTRRVVRYLLRLFSSS